MDLRFDASDFVRLADDMTTAANKVLDEVEPVIAKQAVRSKEGMRFDMLSSQSFNAVADAINYDLDKFTSHIRAEIGPVSAGRQVGDLAHIAYFGGSDGKGRAKGGGTVRDPEYWLTSEAGTLEEYVARVLDGLL